MWRLLLITPFLFIGMLGCKSVQPNDVIGTWVMKDQSRNELPREFKKGLAKIVVNADGTFVASELPEPLHPVPPYDMKVRMRLDSGSGVWKLASWEGAQQLQLEVHDLASADENSHGSYGFPLIVSRGWSAVTLSYALGDPDEGRSAEFEKR